MSLDKKNCSVSVSKLSRYIRLTSSKNTVLKISISKFEKTQFFQKGTKNFYESYAIEFAGLAQII
jgi:hypothetical protein